MRTFKKDEEEFLEKVPIVSVVLIVNVEAAAPNLLEILFGKKLARESELLSEIEMELLFLGLHLTDRIVFEQLGSEKRSVFMDTLLSFIVGRLQISEISQFQHLYNVRNSFYGRFPKLHAGKNENLKDTLFWEFGKALGSKYAN